MSFEPVHQILDWYDGPRQGIATINGRYHFFQSCWSDISSDNMDQLLILEVSDEVFSAAVEDHEIWSRWERAFKSGKTSLETHPALPEDQNRHEQLAKVLTPALIIDESNRIAATAIFRYNPENEPKIEAEWTRIDYDPSMDHRTDYDWY